ncbi:2-oxoisovalerate dehydrogenase subunit alpha, mitochondrial [Gossypium arboreum]|uniref:3-methyl-2-oxobutanoate dehydrogenase (2-methylpropanoyl-transferring) n=1 Tax=Gossypium arboreum TaxID=29729 RepID=A0A0B0NMT6_GOSAR|nr:2-oxoisovalerate dehydrogenase subunit alpha, mitochondrial [Gossypium arboreum]
MASWGRRSSGMVHHIKALSKVELRGKAGEMKGGWWRYPLQPGVASALVPRSWPCVNTMASLFLVQRFKSSLPQKQVEDDDDDDQDLDFPGGKVACTSEMKFISGSYDKRIPCYRVLGDDGELIKDGSDFEKVNKELAVKMYRDMVCLQIMDTFLYEAQRQGRISFYMTSFGEEAATISSAAALTKDDIILPQYREQGVLLWRGFTLQEIVNQCFGNKDDGGKGRQMPVHYGSSKHNFVTVSSPIATQLPQAAGMAYSLKMDKKDACVVAFIGDGGTSEGDFHAGLNFAAVMEAPVIFVCRNNGWAISTPTSDQFRSDGVVVKGQAYGIPSIRVDGTDALAVYSAIRAARNMAINEQRPVLVESLAYRVGHHSTSDDSTKYRSLSEIEHWKTGRDPLLKAIQVAEGTEKPPLTELFTDVYDLPPSNLVEQEKLLRQTVNKYPHDFPSDVSLH